MAYPVFTALRFNDEAAAFAFVESNLWPDGPVCPHCGNADRARIRKLEGKVTRLGLYNCNECKGQFTVRQGTIFESSHLPLHLWLQVIHLMCASKKGVSTRQIQRMLQCSMKTAWFLTHRIREVLRCGSLAPMGGNGGVVEVDETGTVAAGATTVTLVPTAVAAPQFTLTLDHPFLYAIRDDQTGELLFIGTLMNPTTG